MSCVRYDSEINQLRRDYHLQILHLGHPSKTLWCLRQGHNTLDRLFEKRTFHPSQCTRTVWESKTKAGGNNFLAKLQQQIKWGLKERDELLKSVPIKWKAKTNWQYSAGFMSQCENGFPYTVGTYITCYNTLCLCLKSSLLSTTKHAGVAYSL